MLQQMQGEDNLDDVEIEGCSDDDESGDVVDVESFSQDKSIWLFKVPTVRFHATSYDKIIDWKTEVLNTEPPQIKNTANQMRK